MFPGGVPKLPGKSAVGRPPGPPVPAAPGGPRRMYF